MTKLRYAGSLDCANAQSVIFGVNTKCAGTAPTFSSTSDRNEFSADFIRQVDNRIKYSPS